mmetsp:Transcript_25840/g.72371  ORF Transcript_25840/g.72371 Transcript_25840/m.72371 type:complete len:415 (-) Transcript_25840:315-1559(-)
MAVVAAVQAIENLRHEREAATERAQELELALNQAESRCTSALADLEEQRVQAAEDIAAAVAEKHLLEESLSDLQQRLDDCLSQLKSAATSQEPAMSNDEVIMELQASLQQARSENKDLSLRLQLQAEGSKSSEFQVGEQGSTSGGARRGPEPHDVLGTLEKADVEAQAAAALLATAQQRAAALASALRVSQVAVAALEESPGSNSLPAMVEVKDRAAALTALLDSLSSGVEAAHRELDSKTAALGNMAAVEARAAELEKEKGQLQGALEVAARDREHLEKQLGMMSPRASMSGGSPGSSPLQTRPVGVPSVARQRGHDHDIEAGETDGLILDPESDDSDSSVHRGFRPITGMALMRRAPPQVATAARVIDRGSLIAGRVLTGQPMLRLGALGYFLLVHMLLMLSQAACRHHSLL